MKIKFSFKMQYGSRYDDPGELPARADWLIS